MTAQEELHLQAPHEVLARGLDLFLGSDEGFERIISVDGLKLPSMRVAVARKSAEKKPVLTIAADYCDDGETTWTHLTVFDPTVGKNKTNGQFASSRTNADTESSDFRTGPALMLDNEEIERILVMLRGGDYKGLSALLWDPSVVSVLFEEGEQ